MPLFGNVCGAAGSGGDAGYTIKRSLRFNPDDTSYLNKISLLLAVAKPGPGRRGSSVAVWVQHNSYLLADLATLID